MEVSDTNVLRRIARVNRREQWDNRIRNDDIRENLGVKSVEEVARVSRLQRFRVLEAGADLGGGLWIQLGRIRKLEGLDWTSRLFLWRRIGFNGGGWFIIKRL